MGMTGTFVRYIQQEILRNLLAVSAITLTSPDRFADARIEGDPMDYADGMDFDFRWYSNINEQIFWYKVFERAMMKR